MIANRKLVYQGIEAGEYLDGREPQENLVIIFQSDDLDSRINLLINQGLLRGDQPDPFLVVQLSRLSTRKRTLIEADRGGKYEPTARFWEVVRTMARCNRANIIETGYSPQEVFDAHIVEYLNFLYGFA
ncbi:hypothetical protein JW707_03050 [Candidatus Woesearchaeota archaeon]|nr:hypothetical protein [Candidatus Woesearchaeota archaeon]